MRVGYDRKDSLIAVEMNLEAVTAVRVGGTDPDRETVLRARQGTGSPLPLVKGASIKGILRSEFSRLEQLALTPPSFDIGKGGVALKWSDVLFGTGGVKVGGESAVALRGAVRVADILFEDGRTEVRAHVTIDPKTRTYGKSGPFKQEVIQPSASATLELHITNIMEPHVLRLLFFVLDEIAQGHIGVGGRTTAGLGRFRCRTTTIKLYRTPEQLLGMAEPEVCQGCMPAEAFAALEPLLTDHQDRNS